jgi:diaminopimelate decarboxylase
MHQGDWNNGKLFIGGMPAKELVKEFGSPLYVYDGGVIRDRFRKLSGAIGWQKKRIHYAMKANSNVRILQVLEEEGACIDAVSATEVQIALAAGFEPSRILFTGINLTDADFDFAMAKGVLLNIGSIYTLDRFGARHPGASVSIRVNPDVGAGHHDHCITGGPDSKFGIWHSDLGQAKEVLTRHGLKLTGIHSHIGSGILEWSKFMEVMQAMTPIARQFEHLEFVDFGGGIGVPYRPDEPEFDLARFGREANAFMEDLSNRNGRELVLAIEPGRFPVAEAGFLLVTATDIKSTPNFTFVGVDSGFNHLVRPMAYGSYHHIVNVSQPDAPKKKVVVSGYLCESGDVFTRNAEGAEAREIADPQPGNILAILTAGAYGFSMAMNYNSRPRPAEVLAENGVAHLIRRRETVEDILSTQA